MIIVWAGLLKSVKGIYNRRTRTVDKVKLTKLVEEFVEKFGDHRELCSIVSASLNFSPELRPDFSKIKADFFPNEMIDDMPKYEINHNSPQYFIGDNPNDYNPMYNSGTTQSLYGVHMISGKSEIRPVAPIEHAKVSAYDKNIKYIPPPIYQEGKTLGNFDGMEVNHGRENPWMHQDPYGYLNKSIYPDINDEVRNSYLANQNNTMQSMN